MSAYAIALSHPRALIRLACLDIATAVLCPLLAAVVLSVYVPLLILQIFTEVIYSVLLRLARVVYGWFETAVLFAFEAPGKIIRRKTSAAIIECTCGLTTMLFGVWMLWGVGSPALKQACLQSAPQWIWVAGAVLLGGLQYVGPFALPQNVRAVVSALVAAVWFGMLGWLNQKGGASILHFLGAPLWFANVLAIFILREPNREVPGDPTMVGHSKHR